MKFCMTVLGAALTMTAALTATLTMSQPAWSQDADASVLPEAPAIPEPPTPLNKAFYIAPMASFVKPYSNRGLSDGLGATLAFGYRYGVLAVEAEGEYADLDAKSGGTSAKLSAAHVGLLWFPFTASTHAALKGLYGLGAVGRVETRHQPVGGLTFEGDSLEAGAGYLYPISFGHYEFGIRTEARVRFSERGRPVALGDDNLPRKYQDVMLNLGLQLPFGLKKDPVPPPPAVEVVAAPKPACSDGIDNDGDGKIDFPNDPGCTSADDTDETDPPPPPPPCKVPVPGERVSLAGCSSGDVIVLRGVNFDFDKSRLTPNAKVILDNVGEELVAYPDIKVEIGGYTDSRGSDAYNQKLSESRAASVVKYLVSKGVGEDRMAAVGYGETAPVADNDTDEGRELNRRVELKITDGKASMATTTSAPEAAGEAAPSPPVATPAADPSIGSDATVPTP